MLSLIYAEVVRTAPHLQSGVIGPKFFSDQGAAIRHLFKNYVGLRLVDYDQYSVYAKEKDDERVFALDHEGPDAFADKMPLELLESLCDWYFEFMNDELVAAFYEISPVELENVDSVVPESLTP